MQNLEYRYIVSHHVERYRGATKGQRRNIALQVVREVESKGGRFLQKSKHVFLNRLNTDQKLIKVMQSLRDEAKKDKRHSISRSTSNNNAATTTTSPGADVVGTTATTTTTAYRSLEMLNDIVCIDPENNDVPAKKKKKGDPKNDQENLVSCNINNTQQDINQQSCKDSNRLNVAAAAVAVVVVVVLVAVVVAALLLFFLLFFSMFIAARNGLTFCLISSFLLFKYYLYHLLGRGNS